MGGGVAFEKAGATPHHTPRGPYPSASRAGISSRCKRSRTGFASQNVLVSLWI